MNKFIQRVKDTYGQIDLLHLNAGKGFTELLLWHVIMWHVILVCDHVACDCGM